MKKAKKPPLYKSFGYAFEGIFTCIRNERNIMMIKGSKGIINMSSEYF